MKIPRNKSQPESEPAVVPSDPAPAPPVGDVQVTNQAEPEQDEEDVPPES